MSQTDYDYCVVGAGPSGLTLSYRLLQAGKRVLLIERDNRIGGLAKSHNYQGHIFDTGPKRFHTDDPIVMDFINEIAQGDIITIDRSTEVYFLKRYFNWPLNIKDMATFPIDKSIRYLYDLWTKPTTWQKGSFHEYIRAMYGEGLYQTFFKPYTEKFLRWNSEDIHSDWASTGINRTVVDNRIKATSLGKIVKALVLPAKIKTEFLYPSKGGFGGFYDQLFGLCAQHPHFKVLLSDTISDITTQKDSLTVTTQSKQKITIGDLAWSGNINHLLKIIQGNHNLNFLNTIFYNCVCLEDGVDNRRGQWIYVSDGGSLISRVTCMQKFAPYTCPPGYFNLICEVTDSQKAPRYMKSPQKHTQNIIEELKTMKFIRHTSAVEQIFVNPVLDTYPIYHKAYHKDFGAAAGQVKKFSNRIHLLGRSGAFWYNNSDHSIRFALEMAERLLKKNDTPFDYRHYFGGGINSTEQH